METSIGFRVQGVHVVGTPRPKTAFAFDLKFCPPGKKLMAQRQGPVGDFPRILADIPTSLLGFLCGPLSSPRTFHEPSL